MEETSAQSSPATSAAPASNAASTSTSAPNPVPPASPAPTPQTATTTPPPPSPTPAGQEKKKSKLLIWILLGILLMLIAGAAYFFLNQNASKVTEDDQSAQQTVDDKNTITVWAWNTAAKSLQELIPEFNKQYPDIKVEIVEIPYNDANNKFRQAIANGTGFPDVWDSEGPVTEEYAKAGALLDITAWATPYKDQFVPYKLTEVTVDDKMYALPWDSAPVAVFYRRDLFEAAGVDVESIETWDDYIAAGRKVTKDTNGDGKPDQYMTMLSTKADVQDTFETFLAQIGGSLFSPTGEISFNSPEGIQAVNLMKKIIDSGIAADIGWWTPEFFNSFKTGYVASYTQGVWLGGQIKENAPGTDGKWGVFPLPAVTAGGLRSAVNGGSNLAIPAKAKNPDAAWKFIEFALTKKESQLQMYKNYNIFPALTTAYTDPVFNEPHAFFGNQNTSETFINIQKEIPTTWYYGQYYNDVTVIISRNIVNALNGTQTSAQALAAAEKEVNEFIVGNR